MGDDLTVAEAAEAIGTSPQTIRALLRKGELRGRKQALGKRMVWVPSRQGVNEFLSEYGRLDGRRRSQAQTRLREKTVAIPQDTNRGAAAEVVRPLEWASTGPSRDRRRLLRPRVRASIFIAAVGLPAIPLLVGAKVLPDALWFDEIGKLDVLRGVLVAKVVIYLLVAIGVSLFVGANLGIATWHGRLGRSRTAIAAVAGASLVVGTFFAASAVHHWMTFLLWWHQRSFGVVDPMFGKDIGFFVFSLPFQVVISGLLFTLIILTAVFVGIVYVAGGRMAFRPLRVDGTARMHLSLLAAGLLLVSSWRLLLDRYGLVLRQSGPDDAEPFAGAHYVDVHVRSPGLAFMAASAAVLALVCIVAPFTWNRISKRPAALVLGLPAAGLVLWISISSWIPALVQRYDVDPNPLLSEQPFLERSIAATRSGMGLDSIAVASYSPSGHVTPEDVSEADAATKNVLIWDPAVVHARMQDLVTQTPYFRPDQEPILDPVPVDGRKGPTLAAPRQLDIGEVSDGDAWINDRLVYTHGVGLVRFSGTDIAAGRQPSLLDDGSGLSQPRIYFGQFPEGSASWVVTDTRRSEVDVALGDGSEGAYHYGGSGGIQLSSWMRRAVFAAQLGSKDLLLSEDITPESRILLHRDIHDRLATLAPFIQWDTGSAPLEVRGRIFYVVNGYTTSDSYPYAEQVQLGAASVNYARPSVLATVDGFSGAVTLYQTDTADPVASAWADAFPTLFQPADELPPWTSRRLRYPADLYDAQATAYERFHVTDPGVFASAAESWARPTSLSGSIEVAVDINFDQDDEDDLRRRLEPGYKFAVPPGGSRPTLIRSTYYSPRGGQNLVGSLDGWVDQSGGVHLVSRELPGDSITFGPAQVSRLVFATPSVRNLLGLRNLELRDLDKSSIDTVSLGEPHILFLPSGVLQIQSLYEGASGRGVSRILGVTAFLNGRAALAPDISSAVRQVLHKPPSVDVLRPVGPLFVGQRVKLRFLVTNAERELISIDSPAGRQEVSLSVGEGRASYLWLPPEPGRAHVRVLVYGIDGSIAVDRVSFRVLNPPPTVRFITKPTRALVGRPIRIPFRVTDARSEAVTVSTRGGVIERRYLIRDGRGLIRWTPRISGPALIRIAAHGLQGQTAKAKVELRVAPRRHRVSVPRSVSGPIDRALSSVELTAAAIAQDRYGIALDALRKLRLAIEATHDAAIAQIGERSGPGSVLAALTLDHQVQVRLLPSFDGMARQGVIDSLRQTVGITDGWRDQLLNVVFGLSQSGLGTDYATGLSQTLPLLASELKALSAGLDTYTLTPSGRAGLLKAVRRVEATKDSVARAVRGA
jgi:uncharacterized membrane protein (UPF0182 family)